MDLTKCFSAYFDASGHPADQQQNFMLVSGLIATLEQWALFEEQWNAELRREGLRTFHATDCNSYRREFASWKGQDGRRSSFLRRLAAITRVRARFTISTIISLAAYRNLNTKYQLAEYMPPYALAARTCMAKVNRWRAHSAPPAPVECFFEDGDFGKGKFMERMRVDGLPEPIFKPKLHRPPLQAADFLAWEEQYELKQEKAGKPLGTRECFKILLEIPFDHGHYSIAEELESFIVAASIPTRY